jgi:hypothetical protein
VEPVPPSDDNFFLQKIGNDVAIRQLLDQVVTADVVAMAVGGVNGVHRGDIDAEKDKNTLCLFEAGPVAGVDKPVDGRGRQNGWCSDTPARQKTDP